MRSTKKDESAVEKPRKAKPDAKPQRPKKVPPSEPPLSFSSDDVWERRWLSQAF